MRMEEEEEGRRGMSIGFERRSRRWFLVWMGKTEMSKERG